MAKNTQAAIDELKAAFAELKQEVVTALDSIDTRVEQAPEAADDPEELAAITADVKATAQQIRDGMNKPVFEPSGN